MSNFIKLIRNNKGATAIEYGLIAALIAVAAIAAMQSIGSKLGDDLQQRFGRALSFSCDSRKDRGLGGNAGALFYRLIDRRARRRHAASAMRFFSDNAAAACPAVLDALGRGQPARHRL